MKFPLAFVKYYKTKGHGGNNNGCKTGWQVLFYPNQAELPMNKSNTPLSDILPIDFISGVVLPVNAQL